MKDNFKSIFEVLKNEKGFKKFNKSVKEYRVVDKFPYIFPELTKIVKPVKIEKKTLFLKIANSVWRNELRLKQDLLKKKINIYFEEEVVKYIKFLS